jgi:flagellar basal-body rod protein FlgB
MIQDKTVINLLETAMTAEGLRQQAIASNVANMNTRGYRRVDINFEEALTKAMSKSENPSGDDIDMEYYETKNTPLNEHGNDVNVDNEVGEMVKNSLKHHAFMALLKKKYQQMDNALKIQ